MLPTGLIDLRFHPAHFYVQPFKLLAQFRIGDSLNKPFAHFSGSYEIFVSFRSPKQI